MGGGGGLAKRPTILQNAFLVVDAGVGITKSSYCLTGSGKGQYLINAHYCVAVPRERDTHKHYNMQTATTTTTTSMLRTKETKMNDSAKM